MNPRLALFAILLFLPAWLAHPAMGDVLWVEFESDATNGDSEEGGQSGDNTAAQGTDGSGDGAGAAGDSSDSGSASSPSSGGLLTSGPPSIGRLSAYPPGGSPTDFSPLTGGGLGSPDGGEADSGASGQEEEEERSGSGIGLPYVPSSGGGWGVDPAHGDSGGGEGEPVFGMADGSTIDLFDVPTDFVETTDGGSGEPFFPPTGTGSGSTSLVGSVNPEPSTLIVWGVLVGLGLAVGQRSRKPS